MIAHDAEADRTFTRGGVFRAGHFVRCTVDEVLQDIVEHAHHVFDEDLVAVPFIPFFKLFSTLNMEDFVFFASA